MNWIELMSAVGVGGIAAKIIDVYLLQRYLYKKKVAGWLRQRRYEAFSKLTSNLVAFGMDQPEGIKSMPESMGIAAEAILLVDNMELANKIESLMHARSQLDELDEKGDKEAAIELFGDIQKQVKEVIVGLRDELRKEQTNNYY